MRVWCPKCKVYLAAFPEEEFAISFDPLTEPKLVDAIDCDGLLIDTYHKDIGESLLDYYVLQQLEQFVKALHTIGEEVWLAGSLQKKRLPGFG